MEIYLDNASTTACFPEVADELRDILCTNYGNPSSAHHRGVEAEKQLRQASSKLSALLRCKPEELIYTSGGTESDNMALLGAARARKRSGTHLITTVIEHPAVLRTMEQLESEGFDVTYLPVDRDGIVRMDALEQAISGDTTLVSVMYTNNEIGSVQPVAAIGAMLKRKYPQVIFHVDAVQAFGKEVIRPAELGVDMMSVSAHKFHGPKGVGFLYVSGKVKLLPLIYGGGQQRGLRSGTENVAGIAGMASAAEKLLGGVKEERERLFALKSYFVSGLLKLENVRINGIPGVKTAEEGPAAGSEAFETAVRQSSPAVVSASFPGVRAEVLLHALEEDEIYVSAGSACATHKPEPSRTLQAIGLGKELLEGTIRFSFSVFTTKEELERTLEVLCRILPELRRYKGR